MRSETKLITSTAQLRSTPTVYSDFSDINEHPDVLSELLHSVTLNVLLSISGENHGKYYAAHINLNSPHSKSLTAWEYGTGSRVLMPSLHS